MIYLKIILKNITSKTKLKYIMFTDIKRKQF